MALPSRSASSRLRITVIDKCDAVPNEHLLFQRYPFADERVTGDFAAIADPGVLLDFNKGANLDVITDVAPIEIRKRVNLDALAKLYVGGNTLIERLVHPQTVTIAPSTRRWDAF